MYQQQRPKREKGFTDDERRQILSYHNGEFTASQVATIMNIDIDRLKNKASNMGVSFKREDVVCNKIAFSSKEDAKTFLHDKANTRSARGTIRTYKCCHCGQYHFTSQPTVVSKRKTKEYKNKLKYT